MTTVLRHLALLALAGALSWWLCLGWPRPRPRAVPPQPRPLPVVLTPMLEQAAAPALAPLAAPPVAEPVAQVPPPPPPPPPEQQPAPEPAPPEPELAQAPEPELPDLPDAPLEPAPPPPEAGTPQGSDAGEVAQSDPEPEPAPQPQDEPPPPREVAQADERAEIVDEPEGAPREAEQLMTDPELLAAARAELSGEERRGFGTVLLAAPEEQLDIARHFGEELVLIPRSVLDQERGEPRWFRVPAGGSGAVELVEGPPPLERFRQYRDLFEYPYARLPAELRELRRRVPSRGEVYLFAALIPPREWAAIIGRRREALAESGRDLGEVRRFVLRYVRRAGGGFDVLVDEIVFTDGERFRPADGRRGA